MNEEFKIELEACPFCGGKAVLKTAVEENNLITAKVICGNCGAHTDVFPDKQYNGSNIVDAVNAWNTRTTPDP